MTAIGALMLFSRPALAQSPTGGSVVAGTAGISQAGSVTNINQSSQRAIINWQGFSVGAQNTVNFHQPGASSVTLNRVTGNETSVINGAINANGQVFIVNSAGVLFGKGAQVNTGGLVASTLDISNSDFMAGNYRFSGNSSASVVNQGQIHAGSGGYVALLGKTVSNEGVIAARLGTVAMASGDKITLNFGGDSLVDVTIDKGTLNGLVQNKRAIVANGGQVIMTAKAADQVLSAQVNNSGIIQARSVAALKGGTSGNGVAKAGKIKLLAEGGTTSISGRLDASAPKGGDGGFIETSGDHVKIADNAVITTMSASGNNGTWLIDPTDFTISDGSAAQTDSGIGAVTLQNNLATTPISIETVAGGTENGDININSALSWSSGNNLTLTAANNVNVNATVNWSAGTLTLNAGANIYVNSVMTATGTAGFTGNYGAGTNADGTPNGLYTYQGANTNSFIGKLDYSATGSLVLNGATYTVIRDAAGLNTVQNDPTGNYALGANISGINQTSYSNIIGGSAAFTGHFNGLGHNLAPVLTGTGVFGTIGNGAVVSNVGAPNAVIYPGTVAAPALGILANVNQGDIINSFASGYLNYATTAAIADQAGHVTNVGGLVGVNSGLIAQSYAMADVFITNIGGGLVGTNEATGVIIDSSAFASTASHQVTNLNVTDLTSLDLSYAGGFVGVNEGHITRSYAGNVVKLADADSIAGGFVGKNTGTIDQAYSYRAVNNNAVYSSGPHLAGFVGENTGTISNAYTTSLNTPTAAATASWSAGFAYKNSGTISNAFATAYATNASVNGIGFVFDNTGGTITDSYWSADHAATAPAVTDSSGANNLDAAHASSFESYAGFDPAIWGASKSGFPALRNMLVYVNTGQYAAIYGNATAELNTLSLMARGLQGGGGDATKIDNLAYGSPWNAFTVATDNGYVDAGREIADEVLSSSTYSNFTGYVIVLPKTLTVADGLFDKIYDGTTTATASPDFANGGLLGFVGNQTVGVTYEDGTFWSDGSAGTGIFVTFTPVFTDGANGGKASNYTVETSTMATIAQKPITVTLSADDKVYDGSAAATGTGQLPGMVAGDSLGLNYSSLQFADKNAGANKTVTMAGLALTGADSGNYILQNSSAQAFATISPRPVDLAGSKSFDGSNTFDAGNLILANLVAGDHVAISGTAMLAGSAAGSQPITNLGALTIDNPNYTLIGGTGAVLIGDATLAMSGVVSGTASLVTDSATSTTTITTSDKAIIDWFRFSIQNNETVNFDQPSATSIVLNRVIGGERSVIDGSLNANGRVFILNSAGVLFSSGSQVNVGALVASTLAMNDGDFLNGNYRLASSAGNGSISSAGNIVVSDRGFVAFASGAGVAQTGTISAHGGTAIVAAANALTLALDPAAVGLDGYAIGALSGNAGIGGSIDVSSSAGNGGIAETAGQTVTLASGFTLNTGVNGTWSWSQPNIVIGAGGTVTGQFVQNNLAMRNFALNAIGGSVTVSDDVVWSAGSALTLGATNDININANITATGANAGFVMNYGGDYNILTPASHSGAVLGPDGRPTADAASAGTRYAAITLSGANASFGVNGVSYTLIHDMTDLASKMNGHANPDEKYALAQDIDAAGTTYSESVVAQLSGTLAGLGHTIRNLTIHGDGLQRYTGLIGQASDGSVIRDLGFLDVNLSSEPYVAQILGYIAPVVGQMSGTVVSHVYSTGSVSGADFVEGAGLIGGAVSGSTISDSYSAANVTRGGGGLIARIEDSIVLRSHATGQVGGGGGLIGTAYGTSIMNSYATGNVTDGVGGLVGSYTARVGDTNVVVNSYATGDVTGNSVVGGLIGNIGDSTVPLAVDNSYATGDVTGNGGGSAGGLIGAIGSSTGNATVNISNSFATGKVTANGSGGQYVGGLIGFLSSDGSSTIVNSYASGDVYAPDAIYVGGLAGWLSGIATITNSHATGNVTAYDRVGGLAGYLDGGPSGPAVISNWYSTGTVTGSKPPGFDTFIGGLVGQGVQFTTDATVVYNSTGVSGAVGNSQYRPDSFGIDNSKGLTGDQLQDARFYADGTINQVLADRAAAAQAAAEAAQAAQAAAATQAAAAAQAAAEAAQAASAAAAQAAANAATRQDRIEQASRTANTIAAETEASAATQPDPAVSNAGRKAATTPASEAVEEAVKTLDDGVKADDQRHERERRRAARADREGGARGTGSGLGATIRSIDVDGQRYNLQDDKPANPGPGEKGQ